MSTNNLGTASSDSTQQASYDTGPVGTDLDERAGIEAGLTDTKCAQRSILEIGVKALSRFESLSCRWSDPGPLCAL